MTTFLKRFNAFKTYEEIQKCHNYLFSYDILIFPIKYLVLNYDFGF